MNRSTHVILLVGAVVLAGCKDGIPIVLSSNSVASPDTRWEATLEEVDNGLGFGQGQIPRYIDVQIEYRPIEAAEAG